MENVDINGLSFPQAAEVITVLGFVSEIGTAQDGFKGLPLTLKRMAYSE